MAIIASAKGGSGDFPKVPAGSHAARCVQVIDLGTQQVEWQGKQKQQRKLFLTWETPEETMEINGETLPMVISRKFTLSLSETGNLRGFLEGWRGKRFTDVELEGFDISKLLGQPCLLSVIHAAKDGKEYANVASAATLPKGMTCPPQVNPLIEYSVTEGRSETFRKLPEFLQKMIEASEEFKKLDSDDRPAYMDDDVPADLDDSDLPF